MTLTCSNCSTEFTGRPNRRYCSAYCRKAIERKRRDWDQAQKYAGVWELEAQRSQTEVRAAAHREQAERIRKRIGPVRP